MRKIIVLLVLLSNMIISCKSKVVDSNLPVRSNEEINYIPYYLKVYEADSLHIAGNYKQSQHILDSVFRKFKPLNQESYGEYNTYLANKVILNDFENIDKVLQRAVQDFGFKVENCLNDSLIKIALKKANFNEQDLNKFYSIYVNNLNLEYRFAIEEMIENDQKVRVAVPRNVEEWTKVDRENAAKIKLLISQYGYPGVKKIGSSSFNNKSSNVRTLFLHASNEERDSYILDVMLESVKKGECDPYSYAVVYDKYLRSTGKYGDKVLYGELRNSKKSIDELVINPQKIDSIRKSIGLEHLEYKRWKLLKLTGTDINDFN